MPTARVRRTWSVALTAALATAAFAPGASAAPSPSAASTCDQLDDPIYEAIKPSNDASLLSPWSNEILKAVTRGFTKNEGVLFNASRSKSDDLVAVHRLYKKSTNDFLFTSSSGELDSLADNGYDDQGVPFYAADDASSCVTPVYRFRKGTKHRMAATSSDRSSLADDGWTSEGVSFYAAPADDSTTPPATPPTDPGTGDAFSFAVIPDSQMEVTKAGDPRFANRTSWLAQQPNLAFVDHTGDVVNWDTDDHAQMQVAKKAMNILHDADIPYSLSIGNHDTEATGVGGTARDPKNTYKLQRDTSTFNSYFDADDYGDVGGAYEKGKVDNVYSLFTAGGLKWMVLDLEFCARPGAVAWAKDVVADHPDYNVIISTHSYLTGSGDIDSSDQGYGDTSGQQLYDQLVSQYPNVKMVFSGHVGLAQKARVDTGKNGNKIYSFLTTMHDAKTNPVRMLKVDPSNGTVQTSIYAPYTDQTWTEYSQTISGVDFVH
jgi:hypothetical protein